MRTGGLTVMVYEYIVSVTAPGTRTRRYYHGTFIFYSSDDARAAAYALEKVQRKFGFNVSHEYACVVNQLESEEA